ncbi:MAG: hypothetical protein ACTSSJ_00335 [Candidatus Odinarchaeia archaeon]
MGEINLEVKNSSSISKSLDDVIADLVSSIKNLASRVVKLEEQLKQNTEEVKQIINQKIEHLHKDIEGMDESIKLLNNIREELRILLPVLNLSNLFNELKTLLASQREPLKAVSPAAPFFKPRDEEKPSPVTPSPPAKGKEPDIVIGDRIPSYIREKKKPRSIWDAIKEVDEE